MSEVEIDEFGIHLTPEIKQSRIAADMLHSIGEEHPKDAYVTFRHENPEAAYNITFPPGFIGFIEAALRIVGAGNFPNLETTYGPQSQEMRDFARKSKMRPILEQWLAHPDMRAAKYVAIVGYAAINDEYPVPLQTADVATFLTETPTLAPDSRGGYRMVREVYDMSLPLNMQLAERKAWHVPQ